MSLIDKLQSFSVKIQPFLDKFGAYKVHLCPEVKGRLTNNGEPLANVKIERGLYFSDGKARKDNTYTDSQGNFNFPC
ncbi:transthyretin-like family protein, partial [Pseudoalteromonas arctica]|nr:carboxypeptidase regulatory-like domain-containing protein [Pseudoalteromonas arctica]NMM42813.1 carboxypeptidase regulatory-like domain-containing protein [Pseudoalteromonas arctica]